MEIASDYPIIPVNPVLSSSYETKGQVSLFNLLYFLRKYLLSTSAAAWVVSAGLLTGGLFSAAGAPSTGGALSPR